MLFLAPAAQANTYLFTFTASQILTALQNAEGSSNFDKSGYFAIFVQPDPNVVTTYSFSSVSLDAANNSNADAWHTTTITDPSNPNFGYSSLTPCTANCTWAQFSKQSGDSPGGQTSVMLLSQADPAAGHNGDFFLNAVYSDNTPAPYGWGVTSATITTVYNGTNSDPVFSFLIDTPQTLSGAVTIEGRASSLRSTSSTTFTTGPFGTKEHDGIAFTLTETPSAVPEPAATSLVAAGIVLLICKKFRKRQRVAASSGAALPGSLV